MAEVREDEAMRLFAGLGGHSLLLAVSGGADSMALMHLVAAWRQMLRIPDTPVCVATVDHGLRPESGEEAAWVGEQAQQIGLEHSTLKWIGAKPTSGVQAKARAVRYQLLTTHARDRFGDASVFVLTAHHLDDQAETLLMRLARGSSLDGLAAMRRVSDGGSVQIVRPLLDIPKSRLIETLQVRNLAWIEDPSNQSEEYERVRIRRAWECLQSVGLTPRAIARSARRLQRAKCALERVTWRFIDESIDLHDGLYAQVSLSDLYSANREIALRALQKMLAIFGGASPAARLSQIEDLVEAVFCARDRNVLPRQHTLGGCVVNFTKKGVIRIWREVGRTRAMAIALSPGGSIVWDERFSICLASDVPQNVAQAGVELRILGPEGWTKLKSQVGEAALRPYPRQACLSLPALWCSDELCAVPYFSGRLYPTRRTERDPVPGPGKGVGWLSGKHVFSTFCAKNI